MIPVVILDTTSLYGRVGLSSANVSLLLSLAKRGEITLAVPDVVVHELSRQWAERVQAACAGIDESVEKLNEDLRQVGRAPLVVSPTALERDVFYDHAVSILKRSNASIPPLPDVPLADIMQRDLDVRKPFERSGKGFRDALTWESIKQYCVDPTRHVIFVTENHRDFCVKEKGPLHPDLRGELHAEQRFDVVPTVAELLKHPMIQPIVERYRVVQETFTAARLHSLVDAAVTDIVGRDVDAFAEYVGNGMYSVPIYVGLESPTFDEILIDENSITSEIYRVGDELTIQVTANAECSFDGLIDKHDYWGSEGDYRISILSDWNDQMFRAGAHREVAFTLTGSFTDETIEEVALTVDGVTEA